MTHDDHVGAARLALPEQAHLTGISRIQQSGLDHGPRWPLRFVIEGDHHLALDGIFLHRTVKLPPLDEVGVTLAAAYVAYCAQARTVDAIKVGDWLLANGYMTWRELHDLALGQLWRSGADEALWVLNHLDGRSRSLPESETRATCAFAGLPRPEINGAVTLGDDGEVHGDLVFRPWGLVVEYEGRHHQLDREQYCYDVDRYRLYRRHGVPYLQVTSERLARPRSLAAEVHRELVSLGYDGPPPVFGEQWRLLSTRLSVALGPRERRRRTA